MLQNSVVGKGAGMSKLLMCILLIGRAAFSQSPISPMDETRTKLATLQSCLGSDNGALRELSQGLLVGWGGWHGVTPLMPTATPTPPPREYLDSLQRDIKACTVALSLADQTRRQAVINAVEKDIEVKAEDCRRFGMGRMVPVSVSTLRGTILENGWAVFYKWNCSSDLQPDEMRVPQLTSPAVVSLPPGEYSFRAQKTLAASQIENTGTATIIVGYQASSDLQLPIQ